MKKFIFILLLAGLWAETIELKQGANLRLTPYATNTNNIVTTAKAGTAFDIKGQTSDYVNIVANIKNTAIEGWVYTPYIDKATGTILHDCTINRIAKKGNSTGYTLRKDATVKIIGELVTWYMVDYQAQVLWVSVDSIK